LVEGRREAVAQDSVPVLAPREIELRGSERLVGDDQVQIRSDANRRLARAHAHHEHVVERLLGLHAERHANVSLRVRVDEQDVQPARRQSGG
jgi:hypothetical protein